MFKVLLVTMMAMAARADQEACTANSMLVSKTVTRQYPAGPAAGPAAFEPPAVLAPAPQPAPAQPAGQISPIGSTPESLTKLSEAMTSEMHSNTASASSMDKAQKMANAAEVAAKKKSIAASEAEEAHVVASDELAKAADIAADASEARDEANKAVLQMKSAKASLGEMSQKEFNRRVSNSDQVKHQKTTQVRFETASMQAESAKGKAAKADQVAADARESKEAADEKENQASKVKSGADEKVNMLLASQDEKKTEFGQSSEELKKAEAALEKATAESVKLKQMLGERQAETAKATVEEQLSTKNRDMVRQIFDKLQTDAHNADEVAQQAESKAKAAEAKSQDTAAAANQIQDLYYGRGDSHFLPGAGILMPGAASAAAGPAAVAPVVAPAVVPAAGPAAA